jgi:phosphopantothenoylcysteine decarboxylase/phosphopantothenate--cysteine ligase
MAAAVADFRPAAPDAGKVEKAGRRELTIRLEPTRDVLRAVADLRSEGQTLIGFAAEHGEGGPARAREKLERKGLDAVVLNDISRADIGFDQPDNEVTIITREGERSVPRGPKEAVAAAIFDEVERLRSVGLELRP